MADTEEGLTTNDVMDLVREARQHIEIAKDCVRAGKSKAAILRSLDSARVTLNSLLRQAQFWAKQGELQSKLGQAEAWGR